MLASTPDSVRNTPEGKRAQKVTGMMPPSHEKMTDDLAALIDHLKLDSVDVIGWSDGGIEALLLGVRHPTKVKKIVSMVVLNNSGSSNGTMWVLFGKIPSCAFCR